jgi:hypothetical protein
MSIPAFTRLFPEKFTQNAHPLERNIAQALTHWGQFVDKDGNIKKDLAEELLNKAKKKDHDKINNYFPLPALKSELELEKFYVFYKIPS